MTYDCFLFFSELDLLEIRLNILDPYVDFFVLTESVETFSGKPKDLFYKENKARFSKWSHKIIYNLVDYYEPDGHLGIPPAFEREHFQREAIKEAMMGMDDADTVYISDLDEIWKPQEVDDQVYTLRQKMYSYALNNRSSEQWAGTVVGKWAHLKDKSFNDLRANTTLFKEDGGWHFSNLGDADFLRSKIEAYGHQEFNQEYIKDSLGKRIASNQDYLGRDFTFHLDESGLPDYVLANKEKYAHLFK